MSNQATRCEVCDKEGAKAKLCTFESGCTCWYGIPCLNGETKREYDRRIRRERGRP